MKNYLTHLVCILVLVLISVTYFYPVLSGKSIQQSDISQFKGMSKQIVDHRKEFNEEPYWLDNAFLGMPSYQVSAKYPFDVLYYIDQTIRFLPRPADYLFLYLLFFFPGFLVFFWVSFDYAYTSICGRSDLMECLGGKVRIQRAMDTTWMPIMWPLKSCMPIGAFLLLVQGISEILKSYYAFVKGRWP